MVFCARHKRSVLPCDVAYVLLKRSRDAVPPVLTGEPATGEILSGVWCPSHPSVRCVWYCATGGCQVLPGMRAACSIARYCPVPPCRSGSVHPETPGREDPHLTQRPG